MIICDSSKFIFFHIPKTGGWTIQDNLRQKLDAGKIGYEYLQGTHPTGDRRHMRYKFMKKEISNISDYYKFTFVRNPYDRIYSAFWYLRNWTVPKFYTTIPQYANRTLKDIGFHDFIVHCLGTQTGGDLYADKCWFHIHFEPMCNMISEEDNKTVRMDDVFKLEDFDTDFEKMTAKVGLSPTVRGLFNVAKSEFPPKGQLKHFHNYDPEVVKVVNALYEHDFKTFGYEMINPDTMRPYSNQNV